MARYRQKQNDRAIHLEKEVRLLREEIQKLELQYDSVAAQLLTETTPWNFGAEFFRLFRHGSPALVPTDLGRLMYTPSGQVQRDFLQAMMAPDVQYGTACGVDIILEVWRQCAFIHQDYDILLDRLEHGDGNSIIATTTCTAIITVSSLRHGFPHLIRRDREGNWSPLVDLLLGQQLVVRGTTRFTWDDKMTCVVSVDYMADLLTPVLDLVGSLEVFQEALVTPEGKFLAVVST
ncbi:unnamed protein product [Phytophthora lilii]|uniref:Unnamed protein product n=1 Tax=Phytophthora lilii TaxID=2077276 RepID=A0A9W6TFH1_9STRA|nr:unnamed protein product [Phytophthora lilii]